jgi:hypothetical protein
MFFLGDYSTSSSTTSSITSTLSTHSCTDRRFYAIFKIAEKRGMEKRTG